MPSLPTSARVGLTELPVTARVGSTRRVPAARCASGKRGYTDQTTAEAVLGRIWATPKPGRRLECRAYQCPNCGQWHLTSMPLANGA